MDRDRPRRVDVLLETRSSRRTAARTAGMLAFLLVAPGQVATAQEEQATGLPRVFTTLEGQWTGSGVLLGRPAAFSMRWQVGSEGFVRLVFSNAWLSEDGTQVPVLSSEAIYLPRGSSALGVWLDDRPQTLTLQAALTDSSVTTHWTANAEEGRTEYLVRSSEEVVVRDIVYVNGSERRFAEATYRRVRAPG